MKKTVDHIYERSRSFLTLIGLAQILFIGYIDYLTVMCDAKKSGKNSVRYDVL